MYLLDLILDPNHTVLTMQVVFALSVCFVALINTTIQKEVSGVLFRVSETILFASRNTPSVWKEADRFLGLAISFIPVFWSLYLWYLYDSSGYQYQMICHLSRLHLSFGIDAMGLSLVVLTSALFPLCIVLMRTYTGIMTLLLLEIFILGSLTVLDILGFYILFEASLILLFLLIARTPYGSIDAAYKIVLYTMAGSLVLLPAIFLMYSEHGTTNLLLLTHLFDTDYTSMRQMLLGWGMLAVFAVKIPLMPVHLWLPEAHVAAPTAGSVLLAGVLLKLGGLGFLRFMIPILPYFTVWVYPFIATMCLCSFLFSTLSTIRQVDLKKIVAYSSIAHMALVTLTIFSMAEFNTYAATYMMIAHGIVSPGLFLLVGILYERTHTKFLLYFSGLSNYMPLFTVCFFLLTCANLSFPLTPNFIAEVLCLVSLFAVHELYAFIFCVAQILGAVYAFWAFNRICHGVNITYGKNEKNVFNKTLSLCDKAFYGVVDLTRLEFCLILPIIIGVLWLGIKPY